MAGKRVEVHVTLTNDLSRILNAIKGINLSGECDFITAMNIATLTLKHRQNKNQKQRIILFVGSLIKHSKEDLVQCGKKLKKYGVAVDIISFGNVDENKEHLKEFLDAVNNGNNSSMVEVPVGFYLIDSLFNSSLMNEGFGDAQMENQMNLGGEQNVPSNTNVNQQSGGMTQFERDMALAMQQSLEEERKKAQGKNDQNVEMKPVEEENEEDELEKAKLMSMQEHDKVVKKQNADEDKVKEELLENQDFIKDLLKGIDSAEIKEEDVEEVMKKIKEEKEGKNEGDNKDKNNK